AISQTGALVVPGTSSFSAGANGIDLTTNGGGNNFTGAVALNNSGANDVSITNSGALQIGASTIGQNFNVTAGGNISETGVITSGGTTTVAVTAPASDILLGTQANDLAGFAFGGTTSNIHDVSLRNVNSGAALPSFTGLTNLHDLTV